MDSRNSTEQQLEFPTHLILQYMPCFLFKETNIFVPHYHTPNCPNVRRMFGTAVRYIPIRSMDVTIPVCSKCIPHSLFHDILDFKYSIGIYVPEFIKGRGNTIIWLVD